MCLKRWASLTPRDDTKVCIMYRDTIDLCDKNILSD